MSWVIVGAQLSVEQKHCVTGKLLCRMIWAVENQKSLLQTGIEIISICHCQMGVQLPPI